MLHLYIDGELHKGQKNSELLEVVLHEANEHECVDLDLSDYGIITLDVEELYAVVKVFKERLDRKNNS